MHLQALIGDCEESSQRICAVIHMKYGAPIIFFLSVARCEKSVESRADETEVFFPDAKELPRGFCRGCGQYNIAARTI